MLKFSLAWQVSSLHFKSWRSSHIDLIFTFNRCFKLHPGSSQETVQRILTYFWPSLLLETETHPTLDFCLLPPDHFECWCIHAARILLSLSVRQRPFKWLIQSQRVSKTVSRLLITWELSTEAPWSDHTSTWFVPILIRLQARLAWPPTLGKWSPSLPRLNQIQELIHIHLASWLSLGHSWSKITVWGIVAAKLIVCRWSASRRAKRVIRNIDSLRNWMFKCIKLLQVSIRRPQKRHGTKMKLYEKCSRRW